MPATSPFSWPRQLPLGGRDAHAAFAGGSGLRRRPLGAFPVPVLGAPVLFARFATALLTLDEPVVITNVTFEAAELIALVVTLRTAVILDFFMNTFYVVVEDVFVGGFVSAEFALKVFEFLMLRLHVVL